MKKSTSSARTTSSRRRTCSTDGDGCVPVRPVVARPRRPGSARSTPSEPLGSAPDATRRGPDEPWRRRCRRPVSLATGTCPRCGGRWQRIRLRVSGSVDAGHAGAAALIHRSSRSPTVPARRRVYAAVSRRRPVRPSRPVGCRAPFSSCTGLPSVGIRDRDRPAGPTWLAPADASIRPSPTPDLQDPTGPPALCVMGK